MEDTPEEIAEILEEMVYTFAIERLETQLIGKDDAYLVGFMRKPYPGSAEHQTGGKVKNFPFDWYLNKK